ncbi:hypothetical protein PV458_37600 [Streptomyces sp. MN03-5084-2B]|nr:hypothetical protein [Streptomyces sp. MN03-5084-2B]
MGWSTAEPLLMLGRTDEARTPAARAEALAVAEELDRETEFESGLVRDPHQGGEFVEQGVLDLAFAAAGRASGEAPPGRGVDTVANT